MENLLVILKDLNQKYLETNNVTKKIFVSLKSKRYDELKTLNTNQIVLMDEVQTLAENFKNEVTNFCEVNGIKEYKISNLTHIMTQSQKERVLTFEREIAASESELQHSLLINKEYLKTLIEVSKTMMDVVSSSVEMNSGDTASVFLNQRF